MTKAITVFLILVSTFAFPQQKTSDPIIIPFTMTPGGHIIISAKVNGIEGSFVFDTGAGINLLTKDFADKITDLEKTHHFTTGHRATGEEIRSDLWHANTLEIGDLNIKKEVFAVYDLEFPLDGLISLTPFLNRPVSIDFENKILRIESGKSFKELLAEADFEMPLMISNGSGYDLGISTRVQLDNKLTLNVKLDSGAGFDVYKFSSRYLPDLGIDSTKIESEYRKSYFKPEEGNMYYFSGIARMSDENNNVSVRDLKGQFVEGLIYEGIMGINWIGKVISIDIPGKRLIVQK